ncbi:TPA: hypothetical protein HA361_02360 [Candidatus Woesearchaeota archaeon]|nr:hypothetical protein [Candidatus Woesearchaeota archaeon]HII68396.1 hypothetical protein [Candidatus Woesearchaeota archaeon]
MNDTIKNDIIAVLLELERLLAAPKGHLDALAVRELSNHTIHNSSIFQDKDSTTVAVLVYAISKVSGKTFISINQPRLYNLVEKAIDRLRSDDIGGYRKAIGNLFTLLAKKKKHLRQYVEEVLKQGAISKGSKVYEHGISLSRAASILGISVWELMDYVGKIGIAEREQEEQVPDVRARLKVARRLFQ